MKSVSTSSLQQVTLSSTALQEQTQNVQNKMQNMQINSLTAVASHHTHDPIRTQQNETDNKQMRMNTHVTRQAKNRSIAANSQTQEIDSEN